MGTREGEGDKTYLVQGICDVVGALRNVQREYFARVDDEWDHARSDQQRDEDRRDRIETGPAVKLDEQRRYDHPDRAQRVLNRPPRHSFCKPDSR